MGFNRDGLPTDGTTFTSQGQGAPTTNSGAGTGDNGEVWNPTGGPDGKGAWEKPGPRTVQTGAGGWSDGTGNQINGYGNNDATQLGKASAFDGNGYAGAWGGYAGTYRQDAQGNIIYDAGLNGRQEAVDRARGLGAAAAAQKAFQIDYGQANKFADMGQQARDTQMDALGMAGQTARGQNLQSMALGQQMLNQGVQAQQAGAASTRGGSLAQAAAMRQQAQGQGAFMQQGNTMLAAQRANEMAAGRDEYMRQATQMRSGDAAAQGLNQGQAAAQQGMELGQRQLNQQGQMGYEAQAQAVNNAAADAAIKNKEIAVGIDAAASARAQKQADRQLQMYGGLAQMGGAVAGKVGDAIQSGGGQSSDGGDPYSDAISRSDERTKTAVRGLGHAAAMRKGGC